MRKYWESGRKRVSGELGNSFDSTAEGMLEDSNGCKFSLRHVGFGAGGVSSGLRNQSLVW